MAVGRTAAGSERKLSQALAELRYLLAERGDCHSMSGKQIAITNAERLETSSPVAATLQEH